jgi:hypothetical protein
METNWTSLTILINVFTVEYTLTLNTDIFSLVSTLGLISKSDVEEDFEDTKEVIRIRKSNNRQHNGQKKD